MRSVPPLQIGLPRAWDTAAAALAACAGEEVREVAVASGLAFRVTVDSMVSMAGPHGWPWRAELPAAAERLGFACEVVACDEPVESALQEIARGRAVALVKRGIETGRAAIVWGVHAPEFGVARGLDGDSIVVSTLLDGIAPPAVAAAELGRGDVPVVFAMVLGERAPISDEEMRLGALRAALLHGRGPVAAVTGFHNGLPAWTAVLRALETGPIDPAGLAYFAQRQAESRAAIATYLPEQAAWRRSAKMLAELAALHPFPPPPDAMLTSGARDQSIALVEEVARAEAEALELAAAALTAHARERAARVTIVDASATDGLFACTADLPLPLERERADCREREREPMSRGAFRALLALDGDRPVAQLLYAPLEEARYPIAADGKRWLVFCPWVSRERRGRGLGTRLFAALVGRARAAGIDGLVALATTDERFLDSNAFEKQGFTAAERRGELRVMELRLTDVRSGARLVDPPPPRAGGPLPVTVHHAYNCPLLLAMRRFAAEAARAAGESAALDESDDAPAGVTIGGHALVHGFVPLAALTQAIRDQAERWRG